MLGWFVGAIGEGGTLGLLAAMVAALIALAISGRDHIDVGHDADCDCEGCDDARSDRRAW